MRQSLRRTLAHVHLSFGDGQVSQALAGRRFMLEVAGAQLALTIDLTPNFHTRNRAAPGYVDATALIRNHDRLRAVQCDDSLVRTRLLRAWEAAAPASPEAGGRHLRLVLDLGPRGQFAYRVQPQLRFTGEVQLDVLEVLPAVDPQPGATEPA